MTHTSKILVFIEAGDRWHIPVTRSCELEASLATVYGCKRVRKVYREISQYPSNGQVWCVPESLMSDLRTRAEDFDLVSEIRLLVCDPIKDTWAVCVAFEGEESLLKHFGFW